MKLRDRRGFSILELIAAAVILGVVCTATIATVTPIRARSREHASQQELAVLNAASHQFFLQHGRYPDNVTILLSDIPQNNLALNDSTLNDSTLNNVTLANATPIIPAQNNLPTTDPAQLRRIEQSYVYSPSSGRFTRK